MKFLIDILNLFYPRICLLCFNSLLTQEFIICINCHHHLPLTDFYKDSQNELEQTFHGRVPLIEAASLLYFSKKGTAQQLIHLLKYRNKQEIGAWAGRYLGHLMRLSDRFTTLDGIVPVPLHPKKQKKRGYNQVTEFGKRLSEELDIPYFENALCRKSSSDTQSKKVRSDRWENVVGHFHLDFINGLENKHLLLIDDVVTTGATIEACYLALKHIPGVQISLASIAFTN